MKLGNKFILILILSIIFKSLSIADDRITSTPLINVEKIKPSFEEFEDIKENITSNNNLKEKNKPKI